MKDKINIAELLKDYPQGTKLYSPICGECTFGGFVDYDPKYPIAVNATNGAPYYFTADGRYYDYEDTECLLFPSKDQRDWSKFQRPFVDGDIIYVKSKERNEYIIIFKEIRNDHIHKYVCFAYQALYIDTCALCHLFDAEVMRLATEEEKQKLFDAIKENGYKWNAETKTLEKLVEPKFPIGDWIIRNNKYTGIPVKVIEFNGCYSCELNGEVVNLTLNDVHNNFHLWTIQDAKDGDVLASYECLVLFQKIDGLNIRCYCTYHFMNNQSFYVDTLQNKTAFHPATKEQRDLLFSKMKEMGYKWNPETKVLEKYIKFKTGDKVRHKYGNERIISFCTDDGYWTTSHDWISRHQQDEYELVSNKFDISTLKPFDSRVLVRDYSYEVWRVSFWGCLVNNECGFIYDTTRGCYKQCIPFEGNEHLLGKTDDCDEYYKTWKK